MENKTNTVCNNMTKSKPGVEVYILMSTFKVVCCYWVCLFRYRTHTQDMWRSSTCPLRTDPTNHWLRTLTPWLIRSTATDRVARWFTVHRDAVDLLPWSWPTWWSNAILFCYYLFTTLLLLLILHLQPTISTRDVKLVICGPHAAQAGRGPLRPAWWFSKRKQC